MWSIPHMTVTSLVSVVAHRTGKIIKNGVFDRGEHFLQNGILHFVFQLSQSSEIVYKVRIYADEKLTYLKRAWHVKGF